MSGYAFDLAAVPYGLAALLAFGIGAGLLLYERFTVASRWLFALAIVLSAWLGCFSLFHLSAAAAPANLWLRLGLGLVPLASPLLYRLALHLTGRERPRITAGVWIGAAILAATAAGPLPDAIGALFRGRFLSADALVGWVYVLYLVGVVGAAVFEYSAAYRRASSAPERRRHLAMLIAMVVAGLGIIDVFVPFSIGGMVGITPATLTAALLIMALAGARFRAFSLSTRFGTDEVLETIGDAVLVCDAAGIVRVANPAAERLLATGRSELIGSPIARWLEGAPAPDSDGVRDRETRLVTAADERIAVSVSVRPIRFGGLGAGAVIVARDIRKRQRTQRALETSQRRYASLFWHNPAILYEVDIEGRVVALNPTAEKLFGTSAVELRGQGFAPLIDPDDMEEAVAVFEAVLAGEPREYELTVRAAGGDRRTLRGVSIPIFEGPDVVGVFGVGMDVTEQSRVKRELEVQRRYFADLFESSPEGIVLLDAETDEVLRVNREFTRMFGYSSDEAVGRALTDLIVPEDRREDGPALNRQARAEGQVRAETVRRRKDGTTVEVSVLARELRIPGEPGQLYGVYRDISERKEAERRLNEREMELRHAQRLEAVGKLAGGVAHDFNNLMTVINGHASFALDRADPDDPLVGELQEIEKAGTRAAALTQQLLAYSRRQVLHPSVLEANAVVRELLSMLRRLIGEDIHVVTRLDGRDLHVRADRSQLEQVVVNMAVNARDAMPDGGTLTLETDVVTLGPDDERAAAWDVEPGEFVRLRIADTGTGMDPDIRDRIFEPFFTTKERGRGTGLGLSTAFGTIKQSDGHITVRTRSGGGTRFDVFLPRVRDAVAAPAQDGSDAPVDCRGGTVMVVEDEKSVRQLTVRVLEREGCTVLAAENGVDALKLLKVHGDDVDLVVTDVIMPGMGGRELADRLRALRPELPVLFMSGYDDEGSAADGDGYDFLEKPFTPQAFADWVARGLQRR